MSRPPTAPGAARALAGPLGFAAVLALYVLVYLVPLGYRPLFSPDEVRYAEIPREMLASGDWVVPRLDGLRYFEKPVLGYWLNAASLRALGETPFAVRLPSALAAGLTALLVFLLVRDVGGSRRTALLGAAVQLTFVEVFVVGTFAVLDSVLALFITAGVVAYHRAVLAADPARGRRFAAVAGVAFGAAFLTKGFIGLAMPAVAVVPWLWWTGRFGTGVRRALPCIAVAALVALPWSIAIHLREPDFWHYFFWQEHVRRFLGAHAQHKSGTLGYVLLALALAFPWIGYLPAAAGGLRRARLPTPARDSVRLLWLWAVLPFALVSASSGKLITYVLPCFPPLAALVAIGVQAGLGEGRRAGFHRTQVVVTGLLAVLLAVFALVQWGGLAPPLYEPGEAGRAGLLGAALALGVAAGVIAVVASAPDAKLAASVLGIVPLLAVAQFALPARAIEHKAPGLLLAPLAAALPRDTVVIADSATVRAAAWYFRSADVYTTSDHGELAYGLGYADARGRYLDPRAFRDLIGRARGRHDVVIVCKRDCGAAYAAAVPRDATMREIEPYRVWRVAKGGG